MTSARAGLGLLLQSLSDHDRQVVEREAKAKRFVAGEIVVQQGDPAEAVHVLLEGLIARARILADGRRQIIGRLLPGDCCDLQECLRGRSDCSFVALADGAAVLVARDRALAWSETRFAIMRVLWQSALRREAILNEWLVNLGCRSAVERMAHLFCELLVRLQAVGLSRDGAYDLPLRQIELAEIAGLSTVHVNRTLQALRGDGLIEFKSQRLKVLDLDRLKARATFDAGYLEGARATPSSPPAWASASTAGRGRR